ncbi:MAG: ATP-binding cassette domain-containing protein [Candidatus Binataceae bacterium]
MFVRLADLSFSFADSVPILCDVSFQLAPGWTGVVGANGAGKTTLLRLITGDLEPVAGHVHFDPPGAAISVCPQTVEVATPAIESLAVAPDGNSRRIHGELALDPASLERWPTLSPGERKRWQVGAALAVEPAILVLDEPTDHLDADARELLVAALARFRGIGIVVSHDRTLLERLTAYTIRVHEGSARIFRGSYEEAKRTWEAEERELYAEHERLKHQQQNLARRLADKRRMFTTAQVQRSRENRVRGLFDHQVAAPARTIAGRTAQDIGVIRRNIARVASELEQFDFSKEKGRALFVDYRPAPMSRIFALDTPALCAAVKPIVADVHVVVGRESKIRVAGINGAGKTTLLNAMIAASHLPADRMLHLPQELTREDGIALLDSIRTLAPGLRSRVLTLAAALGLDPDRVLASHSPSPGEARKLALAYGLGRQVWACVLDKPTNHLDMPAIERLEDALAEYPGALVMVTHDDALARRCTNEEWRIEAGRIAIGSR